MVMSIEIEQFYQIVQHLYYHMVSFTIQNLVLTSSVQVSTNCFSGQFQSVSILDVVPVLVLPQLSRQGENKKHQISATICIGIITAKEWTQHNGYVSQKLSPTKIQNWVMFSGLQIFTILYFIIHHPPPEAMFEKILNEHLIIGQNMCNVCVTLCSFF